jgi:hypothetical protein
VVAESSRAAEKRAEHAGNIKQHGVDQCSEGSMQDPNAPDATSDDTIGVMLGARTGNDNSAAEEDAPEAVAIEEEPEIEEINQAPKEIVQLQRIHVSRKCHGEWVFHEEDHSKGAMLKLQRTIDDLISKIKVKAPQALSCADESFVVL